MGLLAALQFLTRIPIHTRREHDLRRAIVWFPVAGALIGVLAGAIGAGTWELTPPLVAGAVTVAVGLLVTGAFHEDGLADVADAFGGGWTVERRLEILKDSRDGTYGVAALCTSIVVRVVAFGSLPGPATLFAAAVAVHTMGRAAAVGLGGAMRLATHAGLGADYGRRTTPARAAVAVVSGLAITALAVGWWMAPLAGAALLAAVATGLLAKRKIGGLSGDVLGACEQVTECLCAIVLSGLALHHPLYW
jgi:adenosylcobinamide-GDP ribazoletransferase